MPAPTTTGGRHEPARRRRPAPRRRGAHRRRADAPAARRGDVLIVAVTDGEASHARSTCITPDELRARRAAERDRGAAPARRHRRGHPARRARPGLPARRRRSRRRSPASCAAATPSSGRRDADRHPDHVAVADALSPAAPGVVGTSGRRRRGRSCTARGRAPSFALELDAAAWAAKRHAMAAYVSQLDAARTGPGRRTGRPPRRAGHDAAPVRGVPRRRGVT